MGGLLGVTASTASYFRMGDFMTCREVYRLIFSWLEIQKGWGIGRMTGYKTQREREQIIDGFYLNLAAIASNFQVPVELANTPLREAIDQAKQYLNGTENFSEISKRLERVKEYILKHNLR